LTDFDKFCTRLTRNEFYTSEYQNVSLYHVSAPPCRSENVLHGHRNFYTKSIKI